MRELLILIRTLMLSAATLLFVTGCNNSSTEISEDTLDQTDQTKEWKIQLIVEDTAASLKNSGSYLGQISSAEDGKDKYDLKALGGSFGGKYLTVTFPIDNSAEGYNSDYHQSKETKADSWTFTVKTDDPDSTVTIGWMGVYALYPTRDEQNRIVYEQELRENDKLLSRMQLVDTETNETVPAFANNKLQSYTFNMNGETERTFRWELLEDVVDAKVQDQGIAALMKADAKFIKQASQFLNEIDPTEPPNIGDN